MFSKALLALCEVALLGAGVSPEGEVFRKAPAVSRDGSGARIAFALSRPTDVEIAVLNGEGKVVRHLVAGRVGGNQAVAPLKPRSLSQSVRWDGTDDSGKPLRGPATIRVRAGMRPKLGRLIGGSPYRGRATATPYRGSLQGVAVDDEGNVYVKMMSDVGSHGNTGLWPWQVRKFDASGKYVKTLLPYPPGTPPGRARGYELIDTGDGHFTPVNQNSLYPVFSLFGSAIHPRIRPGGELAFINSQTRRLTFLKVDGSNEVRHVAMWPEKAKMPAPVWLDFEVAFSPDGRYAYYSNVAGTVYDGKKPEDIDPNWPNGRVYRHDLAKPGAAPGPFYDLELPDYRKTKYWMPSAWDKRTAAAGIDTDPKGNVYICDQVNQEVVVVSPEGRNLEALKLPWPDRVQVHPATGDLYVVSRQVSRGYIPPNRLLKVSGRGGKAKIVAELTMKTRGNLESTIDARRKPTVLWVLAPGANPSGQSLLRVEDRGDTLAVVSDAFDRDHEAMSLAGNMAVDREADLVYVTDTCGKVFRYDGRTGRGGSVKLSATLLAVGPKGRIVRVAGWRSSLAGYTRELKPLPVTAAGEHAFGSFRGRAGRGCSLGGLAIDHRGWVWTLQEGDGMFVGAYKPDGTPAPPAVTGLDIHASCVRVDRLGSIYVGWLGLPKGHKPPKGFEKDRAYRRATGSVLKFSPRGGRKLKLADGQEPPEGTVMGFEGVEATYPGLAPFSQWRCAGACVCTKPRFDVDGFGRLAMPNAITFSVTVLDNAGNRIAEFGHYGNFDAQGRGSAEPKPAIPLGWPTNAAVAGDHIYVADVLNHRIVRVDLDFAVTQKLPVR
jgi:sugar lactone lactonase YvrE